jgi:hypothetical protein
MYVRVHVRVHARVCVEECRKIVAPITSRPITSPFKLSELERSLAVMMKLRVWWVFLTISYSARGTTVHEITQLKRYIYVVRNLNSKWNIL